MYSTILGAPRLRLVSPTVGAATGALPAANLDTDEPSELCRINSIDPADLYIDTTFEFPFGYYGTTFKVGGVGVVNHNLSIGATARTLLLDSTAAGYQPTRILPDSKTDVTGTWSGTVADVDDDPYAADANKNTCTGASSLTPSVQYGFTTPASNPKTGDQLQLIRVKVTWTADPPTNIAFELRDGANVIGYIDYRPTGANPDISSGDVVLLPWDASDLTTADGSGVALRVESSLGAGTDDISIEAIDWLCDLGVSAGSILYDSGWTVATYDVTDALWGDTVAGAGGISPVQSFAHYPTTEVSGVARAVTFLRDPLNSAGYVDVGCYVAGPRFTPTIPRDPGEVVGYRDLSTKVFTEGGNTFGVMRPGLRTVSMPLSWLTQAEAHSLFDRMRRRGILSPVLVSIFPGDATEGRHTTIWATVDNFGAINAPDPSSRRSMAMNFVEKL